MSTALFTLEKTARLAKRDLVSLLAEAFRASGQVASVALVTDVVPSRTSATFEVSGEGLSLRELADVAMQIPGVLDIAVQPTEKPVRATLLSNHL